MDGYFTLQGGQAINLTLQTIIAYAYHASRAWLRFTLTLTFSPFQQ